MQFKLLAIVSLLSLASAQTVSEEIAKLPTCSLVCLQNATTGKCGFTDFACQCGPEKEAITSAAIQCLSTGCSARDVLTVQQVTNSICSIQAATPGSASASSSASSPLASTISSASSSIASSISSSASSAASGAASSLSAAATSTTLEAGAAPTQVGNLLVAAAAFVAFAL